MEIIFASTGVECVAAPSRGIIYLDPTLDKETAVAAIHAAMPGVHRDAVRHWVEKAMPSAPPLSLRAAAIRRSERRHKARAILACIFCFVLGASGTFGGLWVKRHYVDNVFAQHNFAELAHDRGWVCDRGHDQTMVAGCVTPKGVSMMVTAYTTDHILSFTFTYRDGVTAYMDRLTNFDRPVDKQAWANAYTASPDDGELHPNLIIGDDWALFGTDKDRLQVWAEALEE